MTIHVVLADQARRVRWRNDGGWTREIAAGRATSPTTVAPDAVGAQWDWRISVAEIEQDGPFSPFPGIDRCLVLLEGPGMALDFATGVRERIVPARPRIDFAGEDDIQCHLLEGPTRDFNAMWRRSVLSAHVEQASVEGSMGTEMDEDGVAVVVHVLAGRIEAAGQGLGAGDTLVVASPHSEPVRLTGTARVLTVAFRPASS